MQMYGCSLEETHTYTQVAMKNPYILQIET